MVSLGNPGQRPLKERAGAGGGAADIVRLAGHDIVRMDFPMTLPSHVQPNGKYAYKRNMDNNLLYKGVVPFWVLHGTCSAETSLQGGSGDLRNMAMLPCVPTTSHGNVLGPYC